MQMAIAFHSLSLRFPFRYLQDAKTSVVGRLMMRSMAAQVLGECFPLPHSQISKGASMYEFHRDYYWLFGLPQPHSWPAKYLMFVRIYGPHDLSYRVTHQVVPKHLIHGRYGLYIGHESCVWEQRDVSPCTSSIWTRLHSTACWMGFHEEWDVSSNEPTSGKHYN